MIDMVEGSRGLPESQVRRYVTQILSALQHLHRNGLVHRYDNDAVFKDVPTFVPQIWEYGNFPVRKLIFTL